MLVASNLRDLGDFSPALDNLNLDDSSVWETAARELVPSLTNFSEPELVIWAGVDDMVVQPALAVTFTGNNRGTPQALTTEAWRFVADAATGAILHRETLIHHFEDVCGSVKGMATQGIGADVCEAEALEVMPYAFVNIFHGASAMADENGDFCITNGGFGQVTVESRVWGQYLRVHNYDGTSKHADHDADAELTQLVTPPGPANFVHNQANDDEFKRAEVNAYYYLNEIRSNWSLEANPAYPTIWEETEFTVNVNSKGVQDVGIYDASGPSISFRLEVTPTVPPPPQAELTNPNGAFSSIIYHEYGHHVVEMGGSGQGQYGEGVGDTMSVIVLDDECVGLGIPWDSVAEDWNCTVPTGCVRNAANEMQYPCSGTHECAPLLSGCVWDTRNALVANGIPGYQDILMFLAVNSVELHSGTEITPQITLDWLILDDDDSCIWEGTPNSAEICIGFEAHNMWDHGCHCPDCPGDLDDNGEIEAFDLALVLGAWGPCPAPPQDCCEDLDCSGDVGAGDTAIVLGNWGLCTGRSPSDGDGSLTLAEALELMDYGSVDAFINWLLSADTDEAFEGVQYLYSLLTDGP